MHVHTIQLNMDACSLKGRMPGVAGVAGVPGVGGWVGWGGSDGCAWEVQTAAEKVSHCAIFI